MDPSDLVAIIDTANQTVKQTDWFWNASKEDRELYKQYYSKKNGCVNTAKAPTEEDEAGEEENEDDDDIGQEEDKEIEQAGSADDEALDVATAAPETEGPPPKRERSIAQKRYQDYLQIAREELKKQGNQKISMGECHALCKQMLEEDGWR